MVQTDEARAESEKKLHGYAQLWSVGPTCCPEMKLLYSLTYPLHNYTIPSTEYEGES